MDYAKNEKYFKGTIAGLVVIGLLLLVIGGMLVKTGADSWNGGGFIAFGVIMLIIGFVMLVAAFRGKPISDEEYESSIKEEIANAKNDALSNLDIDESEVKEVEPIIFGCFNYDEFDNIKVGKDDKIRTDRYKAVVIYPTKNELNAYEYEFSTTEELKKKTGTMYFYNDIVSVSVSTLTRSISEMQDKKIKLKRSTEEATITYEDVKLITKGGSILKVSLIGENDGIRALRALLRDKKRA